MYIVVIRCHTLLLREWGTIKALHRNAVGVHANLHVADPDISLWFFWGHQDHFSLRQDDDKEFWKCRSKFSVQKALHDFDLKVACLTDADTIHFFPVVHKNRGNDLGPMSHTPQENRWKTDTSVTQMCAVIISLYLHNGKLKTSTWDH